MRSVIDVVGPDWQDGVNLHERFEEYMVSQAVQMLCWEMRSHPVWCYCLRLEEDANAKAYFSPFGKTISPDGQVTRAPHAPVAVADLLDEHGEWPLLAVFSEEHSLARRTQGPGAKWHLQIRLQRGESYVGYLVALGTDQLSLGQEMTRHLREVFFETTTYVASLIDYCKFNDAVRSVQFQRNVELTRLAIGQSRLDPQYPHLALRHVADLLTSHVGAGWNRAACYLLEHENKLRCVWAQGGGGEEEWCEKVQRPIGEQVTDVSGLLEAAQKKKIPDDDAYYRSAVGFQPLDPNDLDEKQTDNILARLCRSGGRTEELPIRNQEPPLRSVPIADVPTVEREELGAEAPRAARFENEEPWVNNMASRAPGNVIFNSRNGRYWVLPWFADGETRLRALWILDMGYWGSLTGTRDSLPSIRLSVHILKELPCNFT
jgi:hypothetical protein